MLIINFPKIVDLNLARIQKIVEYLSSLRSQLDGGKESRQSLTFCHFATSLSHAQDNIWQLDLIIRGILMISVPNLL